MGKVDFAGRKGVLVLGTEGCDVIVTLMGDGPNEMNGIPDVARQEACLIE